ncbi:hypothetical protein DXG01_004862 [Tephrocybe rancida]|nr:hypothetical protein DXG01_004862 [Tephrocybe rancida]
MAGCKTQSRKPAQPTTTQVVTCKTHSAKATVEPVDDPPAKSSRRKPLPKPVEDDEGDNDAVADALPDEGNTFMSNRRWGRNAPMSPPLMQDPCTETPPLPRTETSPPHPAQAPSSHAKTPSPPLTQGLPQRDPRSQGSSSPAETPPPSTQPRCPHSKTPESKPEDPNHYWDKGFTPSGSDFGETEAARQFRHDHTLPYRHTPDMEEQDRDDLEAFQWEISTGGGTKSKGKEKEGTMTPPHKSGPIPNDAKEEAFALQATFCNGIEALAARIRKSPDTLYALIGEGVKISWHTVSLWGVFKAWYANEGNFKKPKTSTCSLATFKSQNLQSVASAWDWAVIVAGEYQEYCKQELKERWEDPMERARLLQPMVKWYKERYDDFVNKKKVDGTFHKIIAKTRDEFMHSKKQKKIISEEMAEWESLLRVSDIELRGTSAIDDPSLMFVAKLKKHTNIRDDERSLFIEWLWLDIGRALFKRGWEIDVCLAMKMSWTDWPNFAYTHKLCLINWPVGAVPPGQTDEKYNIRKKSNGVSQQCLKNSNAKQREDPESDDALCIRIVSWDAEDLELQSWTNKHDKTGFSPKTKLFGILTSDSCSGWRNTSKKSSPKFFPRAVLLANIFDQNFTTFGCPAGP